MIKKLVQLRKGIYALLIIECLFAFVLTLLMNSFTCTTLAIYIFIKNIICGIIIYYVTKIIEDNNYSV